MPTAMSSRRMFRIGLYLSIIGLAFNIVVSPLLNWAINQSGYALFAGMAGGLVYVLQQGAFFGGLFLLAGSFVVRSAEDAVAGLRREAQIQTQGATEPE